MGEVDQLFGSCACERNQYVVTIPRASSSRAQVFFDNSAANRRSQAAPVTAWLRIPLDWFHSSTTALFPDETHASIRRTYYHHHHHPPPRTTSISSQATPVTAPAATVIAHPPPTRRQFCGYCGTHLTAWNEGLGGESFGAGADALDVTLGSLEHESLETLVAMDLVPRREEGEDVDHDHDDAEEVYGSEIQRTVGEGQQQQQQQRSSTSGAEEGLVKGGMIDDEDHIPTNERSVRGGDGLIKGGMIDDEDHIPTNEQSVGGVDNKLPYGSATAISTRSRNHGRRMRHRGIPFFEEMVENSPLGRIRRQRGGHTSDDGSYSEHWEIVELQSGAAGDLEDDGGNVVMTDALPNNDNNNTTTPKRLKTTR